MSTIPQLNLYRRAFLEVLWTQHARRWDAEPSYLREKIAFAFTARSLTDLLSALDGENQRRFEARVGQLTSEIKHLAPQLTDATEQDLIAGWALKAGQHRGDLEMLRQAARALLTEIRRVDEAADGDVANLDAPLMAAMARVTAELAKDVDAPLG